jgi:hypothetical protein
MVIVNIMKGPRDYFCLSVIILLSTFILLAVLEVKQTWAQSVVKTLDVDSGPIDLEYNPSNNKMYVANAQSDDVSVISPYTIIIGPAADAGPKLTVDSGSLVRLDGGDDDSSNSSSKASEDNLTYKWINRWSGVTLSDSRSQNPIFTGPRTAEQAEITFSLVITDEEGATSDADDVKITVNPVQSTTSEKDDESRNLVDEISGILKNPLNITNSIDPADRLRDILTENTQNN